MRMIRGFWGVVLAQFFGAFNDNAFRWFLQALALRYFADPRHRDVVITLAGALFLTPYLLFSMHAGCLADRFSKRTVLNWSKGAEVGVMALGLVAFLTGGSPGSGSFTFLFIVLFLMGVQSTYYAPAKYSVLPEILPPRRLSWGNGVLELSGFLAIILGSIAGAHFAVIFESRYHLATATFTCVAVLGFLSTLLVPRVPPASPNREISVNPIGDLVAHWRTLVGHRELFFCVLGVVYIWSLGLLFQLNIPLYVKLHLAYSESWIGYPMATVAVGVGIGSVVAGFLSGKTIELGLVVLGSVGLSFFSIVLFWTDSSSAWTLAAIASVGFSAGFLIVPFHAYVQAESPDDDKGGMIAATNLLQTAGMLAAAGVFFGLRSLFELSPRDIYLVSGCATMAITVVVVWLFPSLAARAALWALRRTLHRVRTDGTRHFEARQPILVSVTRWDLFDALLVATSTHRAVRLLYPTDRDGASSSFVRWVARSLGGTEVRDGEEAIERARQSLSEGKVVVVPEGKFLSASSLRDLRDGTGAVALSATVDHGRVGRLGQRAIEIQASEDRTRS